MERQRSSLVPIGEVISDLRPERGCRDYVSECSRIVILAGRRRSRAVVARSRVPALFVQPLSRPLPGSGHHASELTARKSHSEKPLSEPCLD